MTVFWQIPKNRQNRDKGRGIKKGERIMTEKPDYQVGDIVKLKKPHPCGSSEWEILRGGGGFPLKNALAAAIRSWWPGGWWRRIPEA